MQANTAGVNRKWTELQEESSAFCFVLEEKSKKNQTKWNNNFHVKPLTFVI